MATSKKRTIRLISVANAFWMTGQGLGGGDKRAIEILKRFLRSMKVTCMISKMGYNNYSSYISLDYIVIPSVDKLGMLFSYLVRSVVGSFRILREKGDIVYPTSDSLPDVLPAFVYKLKNRKAKWIQVIYHLIPHPSRRTGSLINNVASYYAQRLSFQLIKRHSDLIFVLNNFIVEQLVGLGFRGDKVHVAGAGINLAHINKIPKTKEEEYDACFLGRLHPSKGIFDLIEIWKLVVSKRENARLAIIYIGSKDLELALTEKIRTENLQVNVSMLRLTGDDALRLLKSSKLFVFPSHEEGWGIAICEAMACGLPVVAYDLPVFREVFTQGIITVPLNDMKRFSKEVRDLLEDDEKRFALSKKAEVQASKYDWDDVASKELSLIKNI